LAKHSKSFNLIDTLAVGVDRIQRNFEPMQRQVGAVAKFSDQRRARQADSLCWRLLMANWEAPRSLLPEVHRLYFEPEYPEFSPRTMWSLSNAFTSAFKKRDSHSTVQRNGQTRRVSQPVNGVMSSGLR
jgi:hypothetical protein